MKSKGFTLIELVVVIVILGILAAIAIPKYLDMTTEAKRAHDNSNLNALRSSTHLLYAKSVLNGGNGSTWPTEDEIKSNLSMAISWQYFTNVTYSDGTWTAE